MKRMRMAVVALVIGTMLSGQRGMDALAAESAQSSEISAEPAAAEAETAGSKEVETNTDAVQEEDTDPWNVQARFDRDSLAAMALEEQNSFVYSPYSIRDCMTLCYDGLSDTARAALASEGISEASVADMTVFDRKAAGYDCLNVANRLFLNKRYRQHYHTELIRKDGEELVSMNRKTAGRINQWIADETNGRIRNLIDPKSITKDTAMIPVNALWMKLPWQEEFHGDAVSWAEEPGNTYKGFTGEVSNTDVIETEDSFIIRLRYRPAYVENDELLRLSMYLILDKNDNDGSRIREDVRRGLDFRFLGTFAGDYEGLPDCDRVRVHIPDFRTEYRGDVSGMLRDIGLESILTEEAYAKIGPMAVSEVMHGAYIATDENGTEAAAATAGIMNATAIMMPPRVRDLYVDHPFAFVIREETENGPTLFAGMIGQDALAKVK